MRHISVRFNIVPRNPFIPRLNHIIPVAITLASSIHLEKKSLFTAQLLHRTSFAKVPQYSATFDTSFHLREPYIILPIMLWNSTIVPISVNPTTLTGAYQRLFSTRIADGNGWLPVITKRANALDPAIVVRILRRQWSCRQTIRLQSRNVQRPARQLLLKPTSDLIPSRGEGKPEMSSRSF